MTTTIEKGVQISTGKRVIEGKSGIKLGSKGKITEPAKLVASLAKTDRRKVRKYLRGIGRTDLMSATLKRAA